jgi:ABC-type transport system substrate-binding protein
MKRIARVLAPILAAVTLALAPVLASAQALPQATEAQVAAALGATPDYFDLFWAASPDQDVALAITHYPGGGNSAMIGAGLFRIDNGKMSLIGPVEIFGETPRDVKFSKGRVEVTTTMPKPGDPHCCPTGAARWTIDRKTLAVARR